MTSSLVRPPFPEVVDSSLLSAFRSCPRHCELEYFHHWKTKTPNVHLHAGGAYAHGMEAARRGFYEQGLSHDDAVAAGVGALLGFYGDFDCPDDSAKSAARTAGALEYYFSQYPMTDDAFSPVVLPSGKRGIEFSFAEPLEIIHPVTGNPLIYCGRFDAVGDYAGQVFGLDDKTTSSLGASWSRQWDLRSQFTAYTWGARRAGIPVGGFLIRGISILKTKYETQQAITYRPEWQVERWYCQVHKDLTRMLEMWQAGAWDYNLDHACAEFGGCIFRQVCQSQDPTPWLDGGFARRRWDPINRVEEILE